MIRSKGGTVIVGAFLTPGATVIGGTRPSFETVVTNLFANNEQGFFYDPSDLSTMYQDSTGTTPVTAVGQRVGLMKDKSERGNHAYQTTSVARPILQNTPHRIDFGAVLDKLITNLPAQLTGCTVIRSVPSVGTQILTNQTIPATYKDDTDHCGLIVINRVLTSSETSVITAEFNKRASV